jgi:hypothetical protein
MDDEPATTSSEINKSNDMRAGPFRAFDEPREAECFATRAHQQAPRGAGTSRAAIPRRWGFGHDTDPSAEERDETGEPIEPRIPCWALAVPGEAVRERSLAFETVANRLPLPSSALWVHSK